MKSVQAGDKWTESKEALYSIKENCTVDVKLGYLSTSCFFNVWQIKINKCIFFIAAID
jgi:hypothetical protein